MDLHATISKKHWRDEIARCEALGIPYLVMHPGAHMGRRDEPADEIAGLERVAEALSALLEKYSDGRTIVCLETTAGQGTSLGHRLEHLQQIIKLCNHPDRLGVCLDTAHLFACVARWVSV
ncbi:MAG: TIM barrel protein, partial [Limisphaerales bacterium]